MPIVDIKRDKLFQILNKVYSETEFDELLFDYGLELDDVIDPVEERRKLYESQLAACKNRKQRTALTKAFKEEEKKHAQGSCNAAASSSSSPSTTSSSSSNDVVYKVDLPANRYDLLCIEGLSQCLLTFLEPSRPLANYRCVPPSDDNTLMLVDRSVVNQVRPVVVCGILRDIHFTQDSYDSFIQLQDKLHWNICRQRTLASVGTHDLDTIQGPFKYTARAPKDIQFVPLSQTKSMNAIELFDNIRQHQAHLAPYLHIIESSPLYPVIEDAKGRVLSLPPIINGEHSKITLNTRNVFIEVTATDLTKANIVLNNIVCLFSQYANDEKNKFCVHQVKIQNISDGNNNNGKNNNGDKSENNNTITPNLNDRSFDVDIDYVNQYLGLSLSSDDAVKLLKRMSIRAETMTDSTFKVHAPPTRSDILHPCDVVEDIGIAYGFNKLPSNPPTTICSAQQQIRNKIGDLLRYEIAFSGFTEILTFSLCTVEDNFVNLQRKQGDDNVRAVIIDNPKNSETGAGRVNLLAGALKTLRSNRSEMLPVKVFEISDVMVLDDSIPVGSRNERHLVAVFAGTSSGFEVIHGLLDRIMRLLEVPPFDRKNGYYLVESEDGALLDGRRADVIVKGKKIGSMGIIHPTVLDNYSLSNPASMLELCIEGFI